MADTPASEGKETPGRGPVRHRKAPAQAVPAGFPAEGWAGAGAKRAQRARSPQGRPGPVARPASLKPRHWGLLAGLAALVAAPLAATAFYLWAVAEDRYGSTVGFTVRSHDSSSAQDLLGGLAQFSGGAPATDNDILFQYIRSQEMAAEVDRMVGLKAHFSARWGRDKIFALWPDATREDLTWFWRRITQVSFNSASGLIEVQASAYDPATAQEITRAVLELSQNRINGLNRQAREDAMRFARADLDAALARLKSAREALVQFRTRTRIVDPSADMQSRMGVMNNLQQQLAEALIEHDLLHGTVPPADPRLRKAQQRISVIRGRIDAERQTFASGGGGMTGAVGEDYPTLIAEYERLSVDREYAEAAYTAALAAAEIAREDATRQSRYLAAYIRPTLAEAPEFPDRPVLAGLAAMFLLLVWSVLALVYYSIRDRGR